jgi:hypothetical protein
LFSIAPIAGIFISNASYAYYWIMWSFIIAIVGTIILIVLWAWKSKFPLHNKLGLLDQV